MNLFVFDPIAQMLGSWASEICIASVCLRLAIAIAFASVIGCERSTKRHSAGLRTFILISFSSAIAMMLDLFLMQSFSVKLPLLSTASIISTAMISGNSVLFSSVNQIRGLTTSAGLWCCGIIGLTAGAGCYTVALIAFVLLLSILMYLPPIEVYLKNRSNHFGIHLELKNRSSLQDFVTTTRRLGLRIDGIEFNSAYLGSGLSVYSVNFTVESKELKKYKTHHEIIEALRSIDYICFIEEIS